MLQQGCSGVSGCLSGSEAVSIDSRASRSDSKAETSNAGEGLVARGDAVAAWQRIQQSMKPPRCKGHGEACVVRQVKKKGPNQGRVFFVCARAAGPKDNPAARCDHFEWARGAVGKR